MASNVKKYIVTAITLGAIAMTSGLLVAGTNLITRGRIDEYEKSQINNGIQNIFDNYENAHYTSVDGIERNKTTNRYVTNVYYVYGIKEGETDETFAGWAFKTIGSNNYGKVSLMIGFNADRVYKNISVVTNEQSFASTLKKKYIIKVQAGEREVADVSCGATYGAKLVRDMVTCAQTMVSTVEKK